jgi:hypothetical protein
MKHNCRLGNVTGADGSGGWSFMVIGNDNETLFWVTCDTRPEVEAAHKLMGEALALEGARVVIADPVK